MKSISLKHYITAGHIAAYITERCRSGQAAELNYPMLSKKFALCETALKEAFRLRYRTSLHAFVITEKMNYVIELLQTTDLPLKAIAALAGYRERSNFSRDFTRHFGTTPVRWRNKQALATAWMG